MIPLPILNRSYRLFPEHAATITVVPAPARLSRLSQVIRSLRRGLAWEREWAQVIA